MPREMVPPTNFFVFENWPHLHRRVFPGAWWSRRPPRYSPLCRYVSSASMGCGGSKLDENKDEAEAEPVQAEPEKSGGLELRKSAVDSGPLSADDLAKRLIGSMFVPHAHARSQSSIPVTTLRPHATLYRAGPPAALYTHSASVLCGHSVHRIFCSTARFHVII